MNNKLSGKDLTMVAWERFGVVRLRHLPWGERWPFVESDYSLRYRVTERVRQVVLLNPPGFWMRLVWWASATGASVMRTIAFCSGRK